MPGLVVAARNCLLYVIEKVSGLKCLVLDGGTVGIVALVLSQSAILTKDVYLVSRIDSQEVFGQATELSPSLKNLKAVFFIRPTSDNFLRLTKELKSPRFGQYFIYFTAPVTTLQLQRIARSDELESVQRVEVAQVDISPLHHNLFSLDIPSTSSLAKVSKSSIVLGCGRYRCLIINPRGIQDTVVWTAYEETIFSRIVDGIESACLLLGVTFPVIRSSYKSTICRKLSAQLSARLAERVSLSETKNTFSNDMQITPSKIVLLIDRRDDPVTPLLNQWTYQAMVHELLGIHDNRVALPSTDDTGEVVHPREFVLDPSIDSFYAENLYSNFGDLAVAVDEYVKQYQQQSKSAQEIASIDDMRKLVDDIGEIRSMSGNVSKHVSILHELSKIVERENLLEVSSLEQDLACNENRTEQLKFVLERLRAPETGNMERLRLVLLYVLRYENDGYIGQLKSELMQAGVSESQIDLVETLVAYAGSGVRTGDLFSNKNFFSIAKNAVRRHMKGVQNVYIQHKSILRSTVESLIQGKLKESDYPTTTPIHMSDSAINISSSIAVERTTTSNEVPSMIVVFVVGGCTYEESRDIEALRKENSHCEVYLGGTTIHNSSSYLADVAQYALSPAVFPDQEQMVHGYSNVFSGRVR